MERIASENPVGKLFQEHVPRAVAQTGVRASLSNVVFFTQSALSGWDDVGAGLWQGANVYGLGEESAWICSGQAIVTKETLGLA